MPDFTISLPYAAKLLINQDADTLQFCSRTSGALVSFNEAYLERAQDFGEISAYKTFTPAQMRHIQDASDVLENPDDFIALPRCGEMNMKSLMLEFASDIGSQTGSELKKAVNSLFGSKVARYQKVLERTGHTADWENFILGKYMDIMRKWCEENGIACTEELIEQPEDIPEEGELELKEDSENIEADDEKEEDEQE